MWTMSVRFKKKKNRNKHVYIYINVNVKEEPIEPWKVWDTCESKPFQRFRVKVLDQSKVWWEY